MTPRKLFLALGLGLAFAMMAAAPPASAALVTIFPLPGSVSRPEAIVAGPDGALWFTQSSASRMGRVTTAGAFSQFRLPRGSEPDVVAAGPDGAIWYAGPRRIGRITAGGAISEFPLPRGRLATGSRRDPTAPCGSAPRTDRADHDQRTASAPSAYRGAFFADQIVAGPDRALWFTDLDDNDDRADHDRREGRLFRLPKGSGPVTSQPGPTARCGWPISTTGKGRRVTTSGTVTGASAPRPPMTAPAAIAPAPTARSGSRARSGSGGSRPAARSPS